LRLTITALALCLWHAAAAQTISGRVFDRFDLAPIAGATILIDRQDGGGSLTAISSSQGEWSAVLTPATSVQTPSPRPGSFKLSTNYPNPFNPSTVISFQIPQQGQVVLSVFNSIGQAVAHRQAELAAGFYSIRWTAQGSAGVYFYQIKFGAETLTGKMVQLDLGYGEGLGRFEQGAASESNRLYKQVDIPVRIIIGKMAYIPDTLAAVVSQARYFTTGLQQVHYEAVVADLHNDIVEQMDRMQGYRLAEEHTYLHTDLPRLVKGGVDVQVFALWVSPTAYPTLGYKKVTDYFDLLIREFSASPDRIETAFNIKDVERIAASQKIAAVLAVEGGHVIENDIAKLLALYQRGMRIMTITWNNSTSWAVSAQDARSATVGLSDFGKRVVRTLDSLGVIIDVSHTGKKTISDILAITRQPVIASHSGAAALRAHYRNLDDGQILAIAQRGGVIGVLFYPPYLSSITPVEIDAVIRHIDYIVNLVGVDYVALGSDFDGIEKTVVGLNDVRSFPALTRALFAHGYSRTEVEKIVGGNFLRVLKQVCPAR
jgi:membrane dipeptidase